MLALTGNDLLSGLSPQVDELARPVGFWSLIIAHQAVISDVRFSVTPGGGGPHLYLRMGTCGRSQAWTAFLAAGGLAAPNCRMRRLLGSLAFPVPGSWCPSPGGCAQTKLQGIKKISGKNSFLVFGFLSFQFRG